MPDIGMQALDVFTTPAANLEHVPGQTRIFVGFVGESKNQPFPMLMSQSLRPWSFGTCASTPVALGVYVTATMLMSSDMPIGGDGRSNLHCRVVLEMLSIASTN